MGEKHRDFVGGMKKVKELIFIGSSLTISNRNQLFVLQEKITGNTGGRRTIEELGFAKSRTQGSFWRSREGVLIA